MIENHHDLPTLQKLIVHSYGPREQMRIAVGDIIRCSKFNLAYRDERSGIVHVAHGWAYDYEEDDYRKAVDDSRSTAAFLVTSLHLFEVGDPEDFRTGIYRLSRVVNGMRLTHDLCLPHDAERIRFCMEEPTSLSQAREADLIIVGFVEMPITWPDGESPN